MKVLVRSGHHRGLTGNIRGDLDERRKTLGREGKVIVRDTGLPKPNDMIQIKLKHLDHADGDLFNHRNG